MKQTCKFSQRIWLTENRVVTVRKKKCPYIAQKPSGLDCVLYMRLVAYLTRTKKNSRKPENEKDCNWPTHSRNLDLSYAARLKEWHGFGFGQSGGEEKPGGGAHAYKYKGKWGNTYDSRYSELRCVGSRDSQIKTDRRPKFARKKNAICLTKGPMQPLKIATKKGQPCTAEPLGFEFPISC